MRRDGAADCGGVLPALLWHGASRNWRQRAPDVACSARAAKHMAQEFSPTENFKRATSATLRAIAERDDVTVGFGPEPAGQGGARVRLPQPARDLPAGEAAPL